MEMTRDVFFNRIKEDYFEPKEAAFDLLKKTIPAALHLFGEMEVQVSERKDGGKTIVFIDHDEAQIMVVPEGTDVDEEMKKMTSTPLTLHTNQEGMVTAAEHGFGMFTERNKREVLFVSSLIGKKIIF